MPKSTRRWPTPLRWEDLAKPSTPSDAWTLRTVPHRLEQVGDPRGDIRSFARALGAPRRRLEEPLGERTG
jgi:DNA primase